MRPESLVLVVLAIMISGLAGLVTVVVAAVVFAVVVVEAAGDEQLARIASEATPARRNINFVRPINTRSLLFRSANKQKYLPRWKPAKKRSGETQVDRRKWPGLQRLLSFPDGRRERFPSHLIGGRPMECFRSGHSETVSETPALR
jgi:hypothetical protein